MGKDTLFIVLMLLVGLFCILAAIFNWNFFFEDRKAYLFVKLFGRTGARIFYGLLGLAFAVFGFIVKP